MKGYCNRNYYRNDNKPVIFNKVAESYNGKCDCRKLGIKFFKHIRISWNNEYQHDYNNAYGYAGNHNRVDHGFLNQGLCLRGLFKLDRHTLHGNFQTAGCLTGSRHLDQKLRKCPGMLCHGICEALTFFHIGTDCHEGFLQKLILCLLCQHIQSFNDADTGTHDAGKLPAEHGEISGCRLFIKADVDIPC